MADTEVSVNEERGVFVIPAGGGYSCLGFRVCFDESTKLAEALGRPDLAPEESGVGTLAQYEAYRALVESYSRDESLTKKTYYSAGTSDAVQGVLEEARLTDRRVRITVGDAETGRAFGDRPESGRVSRSTGPMRIPILLKTARSNGGGAILTSCVVRIEDAASGRALYVHPDFHVAPSPDVVAREDEDAPAPSM